jgi:ABC-type branched-subunit amino acid transport system substrate-binding protein
MPSVGRVIGMGLRVRALAATLAVVGSLALAGCGTTVRTSTLQSSPGARSGDGLSAPQGSTGAPLPGAAAPGGLATGPGGAGPGVVPAPGGGIAPGSPGGTAGGTTTTTSARITSPIEVGILYSVNDGAESAGVDNGNTFSTSRAVHAMVASYNRTGGIGGRQIKPVYAEVHSASNDYDSQFQAACAAFTQDHHVSFALVFDGFYSETLLACLTKAAVPIVGGDYTAPDRTDAEQYPYYVTPIVPLADTRYADEVQRMTMSGFLTGKSRVGVVIEGCPIDDRVYKNALEPALHRARLTIAATTRTRCFMSLPDFGGMASDTQSAVLAFRQQNVDRVMFVSEAAEGNLVLVFAEAADAQKYTPGYVLDSTGSPAVLAANLPASQLANTRGVGWIPALDTQDRGQLRPGAASRACLGRFEQLGLQAVSSADFYTAYATCDGFGFADAVLRASRGNSATAAVLAALDVVGRRYAAATTVDGSVAVSRARRAGAGAGRLFAFGTSCSCFAYTGGPFPL